MQRKLFTLIIVIILVLTFILKSRKQDYLYSETSYLDTVSVLHLKNINKHKAQKIFSEVKELFILFDETFSLTNVDSHLYRFNQLETNKPFKLNSLFYEAYMLSLDFNKRSFKALDPSIYPLAKVWGFVPNGIKNKPDINTLKTLVSLVGLEKIRLSNIKGEYYLTKTIKPLIIDKQEYKQGLDFGFFLKGLICEKVAHILNKYGIKEATFNCGLSSGFVLGQDKASIKYHNQSREVLLNNSAYSVSGDAYRYFKKNDKVYSHLFDVKSGQVLVLNYPLVAVFNKSALEADYLSTLSCIKGVEILNNYQALYYRNKWYTKNIVLEGER